jgi:hypothetical protein
MSSAFRSVIHELSLGEGGFNAEGNIGPFGLSDADEFGDAFFGDIEGMDEKVVFGCKLGAVGAEHFCEFGDAGVKHDLTLPGLVFTRMMGPGILSALLRCGLDPRCDEVLTFRRD